MTEKINYLKIMENQISEMDIPTNGRRTLLLHACCGPCSSAVLEQLTAFFDIRVFYYNPNIFPESEYEKRFAELQKLCEQMPFAGRVDLIRGVYEPDRYLSFVKGLENEPEGGRRCEKCFQLRLLRSAEMAKAAGTEFFTTTLTVSPYKNAYLLNRIGEAIEKETGIAFLFADFKKKEGYKRSIQLSQHYGLYRQHYCGCPFSQNKNNE